MKIKFPKQKCDPRKSEIELNPESYSTTFRIRSIHIYLHIQQPCRRSPNAISNNCYMIHHSRRSHYISLSLYPSRAFMQACRKRRGVARPRSRVSAHDLCARLIDRTRNIIEKSRFFGAPFNDPRARNESIQISRLVCV